MALIASLAVVTMAARFVARSAWAMDVSSRRSAGAWIMMSSTGVDLGNHGVGQFVGFAEGCLEARDQRADVACAACAARASAESAGGRRGGGVRRLQLRFPVNRLPATSAANNRGFVNFIFFRFDY